MSEAYRSLCTALQFSTESGLPRTSVRHQRRTLGRQVGHLAGDRQAFRHHGPQGAVGRCRSAQPLAAQEARTRQQHRAQQLPDRGLHPAGRHPEDGHAQLWPSWPRVRLPPNAADLLGSPRVLSLLSIGLEVFDLIVIDGPPVMGLADAQLLSSAVAATIFVASAGQTRTGNIRGALRRLQLSRASSDRRRADQDTTPKPRLGYGYGYGYGTDYGYGSPTLKVASREADPQPQLTDLGPVSPICARAPDGSSALRS